MKKDIKNIIIILILIVLLIPITYSYAIGNMKEGSTEQSFFEISKSEYSKNERVEMKLNLENIPFNKFIFELKSSQNIANMEITPNNNLQDIEIEKSNDEIVIEVDKETTNLKTITLYYQIPDEVKVNDTIKFIATVTNTQTGTNEGDTAEDIKSDEIQQIDDNTLTKTIEIKVVEQKEENKEDNNVNENNKNEEKSQGIKQDNKLSNLNSTNSDKSERQNTMSSSNKKVEQTVTYKGSDNNYLSVISIEGYNLNKEFSKDNSTYFLNVENDINSLDIKVDKQEDTSTVCIYGNESLVSGTNKILISVTAQNGNVRNYRIYVTKNS